MNYIDIILAIPLVYSIYKGFTKGFIIEVSTLVGLILGIYAGINFSGYANEFLIENADINSEYLPIASFAVTFIVVILFVFLLAKILEKIIKAVALGLINKIAGAIFSLIKTALILCVLLLILNALDNKFSFIPLDQKENSILYQPMVSTATELSSLFNSDKHFDKAFLSFF